MTWEKCPECDQYEYRRIDVHNDGTIKYCINCRHREVVET